MMTTTTHLQDAAGEAALAIETAGRESGTTYHACQEEYGASWEETEDGGVRVYDCDGEGFTARSVAECRRKAADFVRLIEQTAPAEGD